LNWRLFRLVLVAIAVVVVIVMEIIDRLIFERKSDASVAGGAAVLEPPRGCGPRPWWQEVSECCLR
jgi:hypothetical protein